MNSSSVGTPSKGDEQGSPVRRSASTPADGRLTSQTVGSDSEEEGRLESPWNAMLGSIGDTLPTSDTGSYVYLLSEAEEEEEERKHDDEQEGGEERGEIDEGMMEVDLDRIDKLNYDEEYSDIVILEDDESAYQAEHSEKVNSLSSSVISIASQGTWASDSMDNLACSGSCQWAWVVANLLYRKYGEKMSRLRNNIADRLINFRSQTFFKSAIMFKPLLGENEMKEHLHDIEPDTDITLYDPVPRTPCFIGHFVCLQPLPENDDVSMLPLMMKN